MQLFLIGVAGLIGIYSRYFLNNFIHAHFAHPFPLATLLINIIGSFFIGVVYVLSKNFLLTDQWRVALMTGLLGGFTTFSAFSLENLNLLNDGQLMLCVFYIFTSVAGGLAACYFATVLVSQFTGT